MLHCCVLNSITPSVSLTDGAHQADGAHRFLHFENLLMQQRKVTLFFILERRIKIFQIVIKESDIFSFLTQLVVE